MTGPRFAGLMLLAGTVAVAEEAVFRGWLSPARADTPRRKVRTAAALAAFVGWHVLQGAVWPPARRWFWRRDFLAAAAGLGAACTMLRQRTGTIWPGVALHAAVIVAWKTLTLSPRLPSAIRPAVRRRGCKPLPPFLSENGGGPGSLGL